MAKHIGNSKDDTSNEKVDKGNNPEQVQRSIAKKRLLVSSVVVATCLASIIVIGDLYSR